VRIVNRVGPATAGVAARAAVVVGAPHVPAVQTSFTVHTLPSLHGVPSGSGVVWHPLAGLQVVVAHWPGSGQTTASAVQRFVAQRSFVWQASATGQSATVTQQPATAVCVHACRDSSHASVVHGLASSHETGTPAVQTPARHTSAPSQKRPSSHDVPSAS